MTTPSIREPSKRLSVLIALKELLAGIRKAEGCAFDMSAESVFINRMLFGPEVSNANLGTALSIIEAPRPDFAQFAGDGLMRDDNWTLMIQGIVHDDKTKDTEYNIYYLEQDVERRLLRTIAERTSGSALHPEHFMLGGKISSVEVAPPVIRPPEAQVSSHAFFYLPIRVGVAMKIGE